MTRVIEITAKSEEEAHEIAKRELHPGEKIVASEVLAAPTRGIFGIVGNPEFRLRFTMGSTPAVEEIPSSRSHESISPTEKYLEKGVTPLPHEEDDEEETEDPGFENNPHQMTAPSKKFSTEMIGKNHPAHDFLLDIIRKIGLSVGTSELNFSERQEDDVWVIEATGESVSQLIGKHGKTLDSLQYLINIIANKGRDSKVKIVLDVQGYREQRHKGLINLANRMCRKVIDTGKLVELEPMSTLDRRTVHLALKDRRGIETFSKGVEPLRRVVIAPKKPSHSWKRPKTSLPPRKSEVPSGSGNGAPRSNKSVPMFLEEEGSNED